MRKYSGTCITWILIILFVLSNINVALATQPPFDIQAKSAILMDYETVLFYMRRTPGKTASCKFGQDNDYFACA